MTPQQTNNVPHGNSPGISGDSPQGKTYTLSLCGKVRGFVAVRSGDTALNKAKLPRSARSAATFGAKPADANTAQVARGERAEKSRGGLSSAPAHEVRKVKQCPSPGTPGPREATPSETVRRAG